MLSLPSKPWKKVKIDPLENQKYLITFLSPLEDEAQFQEVIKEDIGSSLAEHDSLDKPDWQSRSVTLTTTDLKAFKRKLIYACIMIETA